MWKTNLVRPVTGAAPAIGGQAAETSGKGSPGQQKQRGRLRAAPTRADGRSLQRKAPPEWGLDEGLIGALGLGARINRAERSNTTSAGDVGPAAAPGSLETPRHCRSAPAEVSRRRPGANRSETAPRRNSAATRQPSESTDAVVIQLLEGLPGASASPRPCRSTGGSNGAALGTREPLGRRRQASLR